MRKCCGSSDAAQRKYARVRARARELLAAHGRRGSMGMGTVTNVTGTNTPAEVGGKAGFGDGAGG